MLKIRVIPTLLWKEVGLVKGVSFDSWRRVGIVLPAVKVYNTREVDELILVEITASSQNRAPDFESLYDISAECFVPLTVGGGIRSIEDVRNLLRAGADKVSINSAAYTNPDLIKTAANRFGTQCIVASIDARRMPDGSHQCFSHAGTKCQEREAGDWAAHLESLGAGEILITSIDLDGTMRGYDLELVQRVSSRVKIPVIASGGAGNYEHMHQAITVSGASAVAAASIFHFTQNTPREAKQYLAGRGIPVRNINAKSRKILT